MQNINWDRGSIIMPKTRNSFQSLSETRHDRSSDGCSQSSEKGFNNKVAQRSPENSSFVLFSQKNCPRTFNVLEFVCFSLNNFMRCLKLDAPCDPKKIRSNFVNSKFHPWSVFTFKEFVLVGIVCRFWWENLFRSSMFASPMAVSMIFMEVSSFFFLKTCLHAAQVADGSFLRRSRERFHFS